MSPNNKIVSICAALMVASTGATQGGYAVDVLETVSPTSASLTWFQNEREDYALVYNTSTPSERQTVAVINGTRYTLSNFTAVDINESGQMCGYRWLRDEQVVGVTWDMQSGFSVLPGSRRTFPSWIGDNGDVGGAIEWSKNPCIWRDGNVILLPSGTGNVQFVVEEAGIVAGHYQDGGHGTYPWLIFPGAKSWWLGNYLYLIKALPANKVLGHRDSAGGGQARIFDYSTGVTTTIWQQNANWISDMNSAFRGVGVTYHAPYYGDPRPAIFAPSIFGRQWLRIDPHGLMPSGWSNLAMRCITDDGVILAVGKHNNGPLQLIRMRPHN